MEAKVLSHSFFCFVFAEVLISLCCAESAQCKQEETSLQDWVKEIHLTYTFIDIPSKKNPDLFAIFLNLSHFSMMKKAFLKSSSSFNTRNWWFTSKLDIVRKTRFYTELWKALYFKYTCTRLHAYVAC